MICSVCFQFLVQELNFVLKHSKLPLMMKVRSKCLVDTQYESEDDGEEIAETNGNVGEGNSYR